MDAKGTLRVGAGLLLLAGAECACTATPTPTDADRAEVEQYEVDQWDALGDQRPAPDTHGAPAASERAVVEKPPAQPEREPRWPKCQPDGPTIGVALIGQLAATEKNMHFIAYHVEVTNPLDREIWAFPTVVGKLPSKIDGVTLKRMKPSNQGAKAGLVWQLSEQLSAVRVPGRATVMLLSNTAGPFASRTDEVFEVALADAVSIGGKAATAWLGHEGLLPGGGEFRPLLEGTERERKIADGEDGTLSVNWLCAFEIPAAPFSRAAVSAPP